MRDERLQHAFSSVPVRAAIDAIRSSNNPRPNRQCGRCFMRCCLGIAVFGLSHLDSRLHELILLPDCSVVAKREHCIEIMLVQQVAIARPFKYSSHEPICHFGKIENAPLGDEVTAVCVVFYVADRFDGVIPLCLGIDVAEVSPQVPVRVVEVVCCISKCVDFKLGKQRLRNLRPSQPLSIITILCSTRLAQKPVHYKASLDTSLTVENEHYLVIIAVHEGVFDLFVCYPDIVRRV